MVRLIAVLAASVLLVGCIYEYKPEKELEGLDFNPVVIEGDIIVGGITEVEVSRASRVSSLTRAGGGLKVFEWMDFDVMCQVWVEGSDGEVRWGKDSVVIYNTQSNPNSVRMLERRYYVDTRGLAEDVEYRLCISVPDMGEYRSQFRKVLKAQKIDSFNFSFSADSSNIDVLLSSSGQEGDSPYYRWKYEEHWENSPQPFVPDLAFSFGMVELEPQDKDSLSKCYGYYASNEIMLGSTEHLSQNVVKDKVVASLGKQQKRLRGLYFITLYQTPLDREGYEYYRSMKESSEELGGLYAPYPSEMPGNVYSSTDPDELVLGFVNVCTQEMGRISLDGPQMKLFDKWKCLERRAFPRDMWYTVHSQGWRPWMYLYTEDGIDDAAAYWGKYECLDVEECFPKPQFWPK